MVYYKLVLQLVPKEGLDSGISVSGTSQSSQIYKYKWRCKGEPVHHNEYPGAEFSILREAVYIYVKPVNPRCTSVDDNRESLKHCHRFALKLMEGLIM